mmetsp:Transcript_32804/g.70982  ORF Transcript_32804/g.70982 Transcript_32804/m.70982 type:complete len:220 (-) Transcript_32804:1774-2433(-)
MGLGSVSSFATSSISAELFLSLMLCSFSLPARYCVGMLSKGMCLVIKRRLARSNGVPSVFNPSLFSSDVNVSVSTASHSSYDVSYWLRSMLFATSTIVVLGSGLVKSSGAIRFGSDMSLTVSSLFPRASSFLLSTARSFSAQYCLGMFSNFICFVRKSRFARSMAVPPRLKPIRASSAFTVSASTALHRSWDVSNRSRSTPLAEGFSGTEALILSSSSV